MTSIIVFILALAIIFTYFLIAKDSLNNTITDTIRASVHKERADFLTALTEKAKEKQQEGIKLSEEEDFMEASACLIESRVIVVLIETFLESKGIK